MLSLIAGVVSLNLYFREDIVGKAGAELAQALREAGFQFDEAFTVKPTEEDLCRMRETVAFLRALENAREATKKSTLHLG